MLESCERDPTARSVTYLWCTDSCDSYASVIVYLVLLTMCENNSDNVFWKTSRTTPLPSHSSASVPQHSLVETSLPNLRAYHQTCQGLSTHAEKHGFS